MRSFLTFILVVIILALVAGYFLPSTIHIEKNMVLKARPEVVYHSINTTGEWKNWAGWLKEDPAIVVTYNGPESDAGAVLNWNSQVPDIATGNVTLQSSQMPAQVKANVMFDKYGASSNIINLVNTGNGTSVSWTFDMNLADKGFVAGLINKFKAMAWKNKFNNWIDASLKNLDESTATATFYPSTTATDSLNYKVDSLSNKVDSLKNAPKQKDTVYVIP